MEVPIGFLEKLWSFVSFLPFFFLLLLLGLAKALIVGPISSAIILIGNSSVIIGLWPAHFVWTYYCLARTKRIGVVLKTVALILFPVPLLLWPVAGIAGSLLGGIAYGFFTPLMATFEAVGESVTSKCYHCFVDGSFSTIKGSCTAVTDFTDFCFHSYFSYMDELREMVSADAKPLEIRLSRVPSCLLASLIGVVVDVVLITAVALYKSPYMLLKGWKRLLEDLVGREGPFLETVCVPFAGLAILLWPLAVVGAVIASVFSSFFLGMYSGVVVHQRRNLPAKVHSGRSVPLVSHFHDISLLCLYSALVSYKLMTVKYMLIVAARPCYRTNTDAVHVKRILGEKTNVDLKSRRSSSLGSRLYSLVFTLQGMVASMSRIPTFRRRFMNLVKVLYIEALEMGASGNRAGGILKPESDQTRKLDRTEPTDVDVV
ncbi:hypothetical protein EUTSA_v10004271mg [Eutrema salsugineum]|uniref:Transmembrane protein n=1 Tax=Eutrema salsugineum TaxID=72664 RepID=V4L0J7_EUTSA|nr:hypothetical protein EUTSA_v10004271mg [Eutrema salsugineum]